MGVPEGEPCVTHSLDALLAVKVQPGGNIRIGGALAGAGVGWAPTCQHLGSDEALPLGPLTVTPSHPCVTPSERGARAPWRSTTGIKSEMPLGPLHTSQWDPLDVEAAALPTHGTSGDVLLEVGDQQK